jgi:hypothetical protein
MRRLDDGGHTGLEPFQARPEAELIERRAQIVRVLAEVRPSVSVQRDDHGIRKRQRGFDGSQTRCSNCAPFFLAARRQKNNIHLRHRQLPRIAMAEKESH